MATRKLSNIRNFCIVAHIDHGKSTLADRLLEMTGVLSKRELREQTLDDMDLERERGITIKAKAATIPYEKDGKTYILNLIDTPGHVDFTYEVSRSMKACEGALLLVDASQGVEAQTVANAYLALDANLEMVPVLNKIDLPHAHADEVKEEIESVLGVDTANLCRVSAKSGLGVDTVLSAIVDHIPPPEGDPDAPLKVLIFDAVFDEYRGVIVFVRVIDGAMQKKMKIRFIGTDRAYEVIEIGILQPHRIPRDVLRAGEVGYLVANIKTLADVKVGDTICEHGAQDVQPLPGFKIPQQMVYCGLFPRSASDFAALGKALEKLQLNDSSFTFRPDNSEALGLGFRCGFLGLLHMDIVQERLERESGIDAIQTAPNVTYRLKRSKTDEHEFINTPGSMPDPTVIDEIAEPVVRIAIITPTEYIGSLMTICQERRGSIMSQEYLSKTRVILTYRMPLAEIIFDFFDKMKSITRGYGTMDYEVIGYEVADLCKMRILVNGDEIDALSMIVHKSKSESRGRALLKKLRDEIPRHQFEIALQAAIGGKIIARESIKAFRKNVTAKCYGGDVTRKRKLLEKQKEGKKRMKSVGGVEIPQKAFLAVLSIGDD
ncbi:MAG: translation elongation factor 4 [Planctomycetes bacterium]|nr:translation elongation factor 4 [Planctomycetota bacterium]